MRYEEARTGVRVLPLERVRKKRETDVLPSDVYRTRASFGGFGVGRPRQLDAEVAENLEKVMQLTN